MNALTTLIHNLFGTGTMATVDCILFVMMALLLQGLLLQDRRGPSVVMNILSILLFAPVLSLFLSVAIRTLVLAISATFVGTPSRVDVITLELVVVVLLTIVISKQQKKDHPAK